MLLVDPSWNQGLIAEILATGARRIVISGTPDGGKSTLAYQLFLLGVGRLYQSDSLLMPPYELKWSEASEAASFWFDRPGPLLAEGVSMVRAVRKWMGRNPEGRPAQLLVHLSKPKKPISPRKRGVGTADLGRLEEMTPELRRRGVQIMLR